MTTCNALGIFNAVIGITILVLASIILYTVQQP